MRNECEAVRIGLTFQSAKRSMTTARKANIPTSPSSIQEVIAGFEERIYPPLYQDMYLGSVHVDKTGKKSFLCDLKTSFPTIKQDNIF